MTDCASPSAAPSSPANWLSRHWRERRESHTSGSRSSGAANSRASGDSTARCARWWIVVRAWRWPVASRTRRHGFCAAPSPLRGTCQNPQNLQHPQNSENPKNHDVRARRPRGLRQHDRRGDRRRAQRPCAPCRRRRGAARRRLPVDAARVSGMFRRDAGGRCVAVRCARSDLCSGGGGLCRREGPEILGHCYARTAMDVSCPRAPWIPANAPADLTAGWRIRTTSAWRES